MKTLAAPSKTRRTLGVTLIECLVYIAVFAILMGIGMAAFYLCWDDTKAVIYATEDIHAALHAGELWRADVRGAAGKITVQPSAHGELLRIGGRKEIDYRFDGGQVRREIPAAHISQLLLATVKTSQMNGQSQNGVTAWRWELELVVRRPETHLPLLFTFEAAQTKLAQTRP